MLRSTDPQEQSTRARVVQAGLVRGPDTGERLGTVAASSGTEALTREQAVEAEATRRCFPEMPRLVGSQVAGPAIKALPGHFDWTGG